MVKILISELCPAGSELFSSSEGFMDSMEDLSTEELKAMRGGGSKFKLSKAFKYGFFGFPFGFGGPSIVINNNNNNNNSNSNAPVPYHP
jgi:hypothetical protein